MPSILAIATVYLASISVLAFSGFAEPDRIFIPDFEIAGSQLLPILNSSLGENDAVAFRSEDAMNKSFTSDIEGSKYETYIYFNRAIQVVSEEGGGYIGDFIDKAKLHLGGTIKGFIVPIRKAKVATGSMTMNNVLAAHIETIEKKDQYRVVFLVEYSMRKVIANTEVYKSDPTRFAFCPDHHDGMPLFRQQKFYDKLGKDYPDTIAMPIDLRHVDYPGREDLKAYLDTLETRPLVVLFTNSQTSFAGLADLLELSSK
ncbi:hypothetical protein VDG1235_4530 [Verrucomicrobiia bacterium DG1235]|nr:hypothetical protein VDG1235_4530 [Verrucomicrobiae bacterium DG1235]